MKHRALGTAAALLSISIAAACQPLFHSRYMAGPEEAIVAALSQGGGLGSYAPTDLKILQMVEAPESHVAVYAGRGDGRWGVGLADAKHRWQGWYAHGMYGVDALPALEGALSCRQLELRMGGKDWQILSGHLDPATVSSIEATRDDGSVVQAAVEDDLFVVIVEAGPALTGLRLVGSGSDTLEERPIASCEG